MVKRLASQIEAKGLQGQWSKLKKQIKKPTRTACTVVGGCS